MLQICLNLKKLLVSLIRLFVNIYDVFHKKDPFYNSLKWWSIYTKFLPVVAE